MRNYQLLSLGSVSSRHEVMAAQFIYDRFVNIRKLLRAKTELQHPALYSILNSH
jgi:hypothetical protein